MTRPSAKKQATIFAVGSIINLLLFCLTKYTPFPFWLDYTGTLYISVFCGPFLAVISLILHTLILCILIDGAAALLPSIPILLIVLIIFAANKEDDRSAHKSLSIAFISACMSFIANAVIFLCCGTPLGRYAYYSEVFNTAVSTGGKLFACVILSGAITAVELLLVFIVLEIASLLTPRRDENLIFKK